MMKSIIMMIMMMGNSINSLWYHDVDYDDDVDYNNDGYKGDEGEQWQVDDDEDEDQPGSASLWVWRVQPKTNSVWFAKSPCYNGHHDDDNGHHYYWENE